MPVTNVKSKWSSGNLQFLDTSGNVIVEIDGPNRRIEPYNILMIDSYPIYFGTSSDVTAQWNGTYMELGPSSGFWATCPYTGYPDPSLAFEWFDDFIGPVSIPSATGAGGGWKTSGDTDYTVAAAAGSIGGQIQLGPATGSNNELYVQLGEKGTETYIEYVKDSGNKSWVEFRVAYTSITNAANVFVGLAEEGAAAADFIADAGNDFADKDLVGFIIWEADPDAIDCNHCKSGGALVDAGLGGVPVANTFLTLGLYFDGEQTVGFYVNGTLAQSADLDTATFPTGEELAPIIAMKNGAADAAVQIDWIKIVAER